MRSCVLRLCPEFEFRGRRIESGQLHVVKGTLLLATLHPGDIVGEMSFLGQFITSATVVAAEASEVFELEVSILWLDLCPFLLIRLQMTFLHNLFVESPAICQRFFFTLAFDVALRLKERPSGLDGAAVVFHAFTSLSTATCSLLTIVACSIRFT